MTFIPSGMTTGGQGTPTARPLVAVRDAWGEFDEPPVVAPMLAAPDWLFDPSEDF